MDSMVTRLMMGEKVPVEEIQSYMATASSEEVTLILRAMQGGKPDYQALAESRVTTEMVAPIAYTMSDFPDKVTLSLDIKKDGTFKVNVKGSKSNRQQPEMHKPVGERSLVNKNRFPNLRLIYATDINVNDKTVREVVDTAKANNFGKYDKLCQQYMYGKNGTQYNVAYRVLQKMGHPQAVAIKGDDTHPLGEMTPDGRLVL